MTLSKDDILEADDLDELREVEVEQWDGTVYVGKMNSRERDKLEESSYTLNHKSGEVENVSMEGYRARVCALTICNEDGERLFNYSDWKQLAKKSADAVDQVFEVASDLNGLTQEDIEKTVNQ